jgi:Asparagine synthase
MPTSALLKPRVTVPDHLRLTPLEELWAIPMGTDRHTPPLATSEPPQSPRAALEAAVIPALRRPPCLVSFSGGVDSSSVLAIAAHVARREGLPAPVPITNRFPGLQEADEAQWQERVVSHLGLQDWLRPEWQDELDVVGPIATDVLRRHGLLFPFNSFFHHPMFERAAGGSLLIGIGGDELFTRLTRRLAARFLYERQLPRVRELRRFAFELSPRPVRAAVNAWRDEYFNQFHWIRAPQRRELRRAWADWLNRGPLRNDRSLHEWWRSRILQCGMASMRALAGDFDVLVAHPLADPDVLRALAHAGGALGVGGGARSRGAKQLVGDLLPRETLERRDKTTFDGVFWHEHARAFVAQWDGSGVNTEHVDVDALRAEWSKQLPFPQSFILLQRAWLSTASPLGGYCAPGSRIRRVVL